MSREYGFNPEEGSKKFVIADISEAKKEHAYDAGLARLTVKPETGEAPKGWKKFFSGKFWGKVGHSIWHENLARPYYETRSQRSAEKKIEQYGSLFVNEKELDPDEKGISAEERNKRITLAREAHEKAISLISGRFADAEGDLAEDLVHTQVGEKRETLGDSEKEKYIKSQLQGLIKAYARGVINEAEFHVHKKTIFGEIRGVKPEVLDKGEMYADNLLEIAKWAKTEVERQVSQNIDHNIAIRNLNLDFDVVVAKAKTGVRTEAALNSVERIVDSVQKHTYGVFNEAVVTAAVTGAYVLGKRIITGSVAKAAGLFGLGVAGTGFVAGAIESARTEKERAQHAREIAQGRKFDETTSVRRNKLEESRIQFRTAKELQDEVLNKLDGRDIMAFTEAEYGEAMQAVAEIDARILEGERGIYTHEKKSWQFWKNRKKHKADFIGYSDVTQVTKEQDALDRTRAGAKAKLLQWALTHGQSREQFKLNMQSIIEGKIAGLYQGDKGISQQNKKFGEYKKAQVLKSAKNAMVFGATFGLAVQEFSAFFENQTYGAVEHGWDALRGHEHVAVPGENNTLLEGGISRASDYLFPTVHAASAPGVAEFVNSHQYNLSHGLHFEGDSNTASPNDYFLVDENGNHLLNEHLQVDDQGNLLPESKQLLQDHGYHLTETVTSHTEGFQGLDQAETHKMFPDLSQHARVDWHDKPGDYWSEIHKQFLKFEGKQQMGYLVQKGDTVYLDCHAVIANFKQELLERVNSSDFGQVEGYFNADGTPFVDPGMMHLKQQILDAVNNNELEQHFQAVIIPTEGANAEGLSDLIHGADAQGLIALNGKYDWSQYFKDPSQLHDGHLPFRFLEMRFDGHVMNTAHGLPESAGIPITHIIGPDKPLPPGIFVPPVLNGALRPELEETYRPRIIREPDPILEPYYGGYGQREWERQRESFYRERFSPRLKNNKEAKLNFTEEADWYIGQIANQHPEYAHDLADILDQDDMRVTMSKECRAVACIPVYHLGEGKVVEHALDQYRKQIENGSIKPEEFEVILFLNHPKDKKDALVMLPGAEERVRSGNPEPYDTEEVIKQYKEKHPEMKIRVMKKEFEKRPKWGWIIKYLYDAACLRARQRQNSANKDVLILTNDVDVRDVSDKYLKSFIEDMDKNELAANAGVETLVDGFVGRIDHDNETYSKWPNFFVATRFDQFLDAQTRSGYEGSASPYADSGAGGDYTAYPKRSGEKHVITQGRNTALRASTYCAIGGAVVETDAGADTELGGMVRIGRRGGDTVISPDRNPFKYENKAWLESDPRRELGMYKKGQAIAWSWNEWDQMNVYGKSFSEQIEGDAEDVDPVRLEKEFKETMRKWHVGPDSPVVKRALGWLGLKDTDYRIEHGEIKINQVDNLKQKLKEWKPKRERVEKAGEKQQEKQQYARFEANPFSFIYGSGMDRVRKPGFGYNKFVNKLREIYNISDTEYAQVQADSKLLHNKKGLSSRRKELAVLTRMIISKNPGMRNSIKAAAPTEYNTWVKDLLSHDLKTKMEARSFDSNAEVQNLANEFGVSRVFVLDVAVSSIKGLKEEIRRRLDQLVAADPSNRNLVVLETQMKQVVADYFSGTVRLPFRASALRRGARTKLPRPTAKVRP